MVDSQCSCVSDLPVTAHRGARGLAFSIEVEALDPSQCIGELRVFEDPALDGLG